MPGLIVRGFFQCFEDNNVGSNVFMTTVPKI